MKYFAYSYSTHESLLKENAIKLSLYLHLNAYIPFSLNLKSHNLSWALCCIRLLQSTFPLQSTVKNHTTTRILFVVWNKANKVSELWRHWEIINIVYTVADRQTCSLWLQSQQAMLPVAACLGWMEVWDPGGMVRLVQWVPFAQTLFLFSCCTVNLLWPLKQVDALSLFWSISCVLLFFCLFSAINICNM